MPNKITQLNHELIDANLVLERDAFLEVVDRGHLPMLRQPGCSSGVPVSASDYLNHPDTWMYSEAYQAQYGPDYCGPKPDFQGYLPRGTILRVEEMKRKPSTLVGAYVEVIVSFSLPNGESKRANAASFFNEVVGEGSHPVPAPGFLKLMDTETHSEH